jgi:hypothetical protein
MYVYQRVKPSMGMSPGLQSRDAEHSLRLAVATLPGDSVERWRDDPCRPKRCRKKCVQYGIDDDI